MKRICGLLLILLLFQLLTAQSLILDDLWTTMPRLYLRDTALQGDYLYATCWGLDLAVIDLSYPQRMECVSTLRLDNATEPKSILIHGNRAYILHALNRISVIDISDPLNPAFIAPVYNNGDFIAHQKYEANLFIYDSLGALRCYSLPELQLLGSLQLGNSYTTLAVTNGRAYLSGTAPGFRIVNISDPQAMADEGTVGQFAGNTIKAVCGTTLICSSDYSLHFYDLGGAGTITPLLSWDYYGECSQAEVESGHLVTTFGFEPYDWGVGTRIVIWDLMSPASPQIVYDESYYSSPFISDLVLSPGRMAIYNYNNVLELYDLTQLPGVDYLGRFFSGSVYGCAVTDSTVYAFANNHGIKAYSRLSDTPELRYIIDSYSITTMAATDQLLVLGRAWWDYQIGEYIGPWILVYDISESTGAFLLHDFWLSLGLGICNEIELRDNLAFFCTSGGLFVYDLSVPVSPHLLGAITGKNFEAMELAGPHAYLAGTDNGIIKFWIYDVSSPANMQLLAEQSTGSQYTRKLALRGSNLFAAGIFTGLKRYDVSDPCSPQLIAQYDTPSGDRGLAAATNAVVILAANELRVYNTGSVQNLEAVAARTFDSSARSLVVRDSLAFVGHDDYLACYDLRPALRICASSGTNDPNLPSVPVLSSFPNPFQGRATINLKAAPPGEYDLAIYNLRGQKVRSFPTQSCSNGSLSLIWNGEDDSGKPLPSGVYLLRAESGKQRVNSKLILIR